MNELVSVSDVARTTGVSVQAVYLWVRENRINHVRILDKIAIPKTEVNRIKKERAKRATKRNGR